MMKTLSVGLAVVWAAAMGAGNIVAAAETARPNIVFILSDDHSAPFVGCYGNKDVKTPNLDRFAAEGMRFDRFFTGAPQCVPSRAVLMTGRSAVAARMTRFSSPLPRDETVFPELLRSEAGYFTGVCGRTYHLDGPGRGGFIPARSARPRRRPRRRSRFPASRCLRRARSARSR